MRIKTHSLALKQRLEASLKWPAFARVREFSIAGNAGILNMHLILISFTLTIWKIDEENTWLINLILTCAETRAKDNKVCFDKTIEVTFNNKDDCLFNTIHSFLQQINLGFR